MPKKSGKNETRGGLKPYNFRGKSEGEKRIKSRRKTRQKRIKNGEKNGGNQGVKRGGTGGEKAQKNEAFFSRNKG